MTIMLFGDEMSRRMYYITLCVSSIAIGGAYYLLFKNNTIFESIVCRFVDFMPIKKRLPRITSSLLNNHLCDFLWAFSLYCGLCAIFLPTKKQGIVVFLGCVILGIIWELFQFYGVVGGTGDILDVVTYIFGAFVSLLITTKKEKKK